MVFLILFTLIGFFVMKDLELNNNNEDIELNIYVPMLMVIVIIASWIFFY